MQIQTVHIHLGPQAAAAAVGAMFPVTPSFELTSPLPKIGAYWPGQGGVYVGAHRGWDNVPDGHLIVPTDPRATGQAALGTHGINVKGAMSERAGRANTMALAESGSDLCKQILDLEINGHHDFFLMARFDAALCYANARELFELEGWYLTSTQINESDAWGQLFSYGLQDNLGKSASARWRACRRLVL